MNRIKIIAAAALVLAAAFVPVFLSPAQAAQAVAVAPGIGNPVNILPSVATGGAPAVSSPEALALMMLQWSKDPRFWSAAQAVQDYQANPSGPAPTPAQTEEVATQTKKFAVPAFKAAPLLRSVGGAVSVVSTLQMGTSIGHDFTQVTGFNDDVVCASTDGVLQSVASFLSGVDCTSYNALEPGEIDNDASTGYSMQPVCSSSGSCVTGIDKSVAFIDGSGAVGQGYVCFTVTGNPSGVSFGYTSAGFNDKSHGQLGAYNSGVVQGPAGTSAISTKGGCAAADFFLNVLANGGSVVGPLTEAMQTLVPRCFAVGAIRTTADGTCTSTSGGPAPTPVEAPNAHPTRTWRCVITAVSGNVYSAVSDPWHEGDPQPPIECPALSAGDVPAHQSIYEDGGPSPILWGDSDTTPEYKSFGTDYAECGTGLCQLTLTKSGSTTTCFQTPDDCKDWFTDPNKASDYSCKYGTHVVDLSECNLYRPTFDPAQVLKGQQYADPETGNMPGGQTGPKGGTLAPHTPVDDPDQERDCFPTGWSALNPVEWVLKPVTCAIQWAFVPSPEHIADVETQVKTEYDDSPPGKVGAFVAGLTFPAAPTGCSGLTLDLSGWKTTAPAGFFGSWDGQVHLLAACEGDTMHPWAVMVNLVLSAGVIFAGVRALLSLAGRLFGYTGPGSGAGS